MCCLKGEFAMPFPVFRLAGIAVTAAACAGAYYYMKNKYCDKTSIKYYKPENFTNGEFWSYTLDRPDIIKETSCVTTMLTGSFYIRKWTFSSLNPGTVTIHWHKTMHGALDEAGSETDVIRVNAKGEMQIVQPFFQEKDNAAQ